MAKLYKTTVSPPHIDFRCQSCDCSCPGCGPVLLTTGYKLEVPTTSLLGSINLLELLTELRKTVYQLSVIIRLSVIIKRCNSGRARQETHRVRLVGRGSELPRPFQALHCTNTSPRLQTGKLSKPSYSSEIFMKALLCRQV